MSSNNNDSGNNSENEISMNHSHKTTTPLNTIIKPFNKELLKYIKKNNDSNIDFKDEMKAYDDSFDDIISFSKKITVAKKKGINCIIYNANNSDGIISTTIVINFLRENKVGDDIVIIPAKPFSGGNFVNNRLEKYESSIKGRNVIILDLQYNNANIAYFKSLSKEIIIIDDHPIGKFGNNEKRRGSSGKNKKLSHFIGNDSHAAVAYTWKFFYPKKEVPLYAQIIDNDDRKLRLPYLSKYRNISSFYNYRIFHNPYLQRFNIKFDKVEDFEMINSIIIDEYNTIANIIGHYYDELANNIKEQVARNAQFAYFEGHPVYVLNYNDPVLYKMVARQMVSNAKAKGQHIDFAVIWGYEYTSRAYKVFLSEFHGGKPKYNLPYIAKTLGNIGGIRKGGGGSKFVGNFYWPHGNGKDIWDLFSKTPRFLKNKYN